ncbi:hypothetical protein FACS1894187_06000 [Synergistales bacterium]|nr:hypothetical protein FACS1894187_06000 [Synergistales bacterium]
MKVAFVTHKKSLYDKFKSVVESDFPHLSVQYLIYDSFDDVPGLIEDRQREFDAIIFAGHVTMAYANARLRRETLWIQLPRAGSTILCALLSVIRKGWDVSKLSFDSYDESLLLEIYDELGYVMEKPLLVFKDNMLSGTYSEDALKFHKNNLRTQEATACCTCLYKVHMQLDMEHLPNIYIVPTRDVIREQLHFIQQFYRAREEAKGRLSVFLITIDFPSDHSVMQERDDLFMFEKMKVSQQIYRYAGHLQATVLEASLRDYLLFSTKEIIEMETNHYKNFELLNLMERETLYTVSIGVGHGDTVAGAKSNAVAAMLKAKGHSCNSAYVCLNDGNFIGPFFSASAGRDRKEPSIDDKLLRASELTGISVNTLYKLRCFVLNYCPQGTFTSHALAEGLTLSKRHVNKILQNLEQHNFAKVVGKRLMDKSGRPSRLFMLNLGTAIGGKH